MVEVDSRNLSSDTLFGVEEMEINFGPQHPATHGVLRLKLKVDGERIVLSPSNCLHCMTCAVKCPLDNIRWEPPEGWVSIPPKTGS